MEPYTLKTAKFILGRFDSYFSLANIKAALVLPANAVLFGTTIAVYQVTFSNSASALTPCMRSLLTAAIVAAVISSVCALVVTLSFLKTGNRAGEYLSLVFFGSIRSMDRDVFTKQFLEATESDLSADVLEQIHLLSDALHTKYLWLNWAVTICVLGYSLMAIAVGTITLGV